MKFKVGDHVSVDTARLKNPAIGFITDATATPFEPIYNIQLQDHPGIGAIMGVSEDEITLLVREVEKSKKLKMEFALEQNFKEVMKHIEDGTHRLVSQEMQHDYDKRDKEHVISINLILKENE